MLFAFVCLSRQQIQPYHPVETNAPPPLKMEVWGIEPQSEATDFASS